MSGKKQLIRRYYCTVDASLALSKLTGRSTGFSGKLVMAVALLACMQIIKSPALADDSNLSDNTSVNSLANSLANMGAFKQVAPGVYVKHGKHEIISAFTVDRIANTGFIIGESSVAIIDPGGSETAVQRMQNVIQELTTLPVSHVIVTHVHPDHSLGVFHFIADEQSHNSSPARSLPLILGHEKLWNALLQNANFFKDNFNSDTRSQFIKLMERDDNNVSRIQGISGEFRINLGNRELSLNSHKSAHTDTDLSVLDLHSGTLWAGDLLFAERLPVLDGSLLGWLETLEQLSRMDTKLVIPGHGQSGNWRAVSEPAHRYLKRLLDITRSAISEGISLTEFTNSEWPWSHDHWALFEDQHKSNLVRAYVELEWE